VIYIHLLKRFQSRLWFTFKNLVKELINVGVPLAIWAY